MMDNDNHNVQVMKVPAPAGTVLTEHGTDVMARAKALGADAILLHPVTLPDGKILPVNTPMKWGKDGYWRPLE